MRQHAPAPGALPVIPPGNAITPAFPSRQNPRLSRTHRTDLLVQIVQFGEQFDMTFKPNRQEGQIAIQVPAKDRTGARPLV
jgi:hypothetical protein